MYFRKIASAAFEVLGSGTGLPSGVVPPTAGTSKTVVPSGMSDGERGADGPSSVARSKAAAWSASTCASSAAFVGSGLAVFAPAGFEPPLDGAGDSSNLIWKKIGRAHV